MDTQDYIKIYISDQKEVNMTHPIISSIERAVNYIADNIKNETGLSLDDIAQHSGMSKYHFHRIYRLITGETCNQTITRLRLVRATAMLKENSMSVTETAIAAGYGSSQAFAKAIKREVKYSATELKNDPDRLAEAIAVLSSPADDNGLRIELCSLDPFEIAVIRTEGKYLELVEIYGQLAELADDFHNIRGFLGLPHNDIEMYKDKNFLFECGIALKCDINDNSPYIDKKMIVGGDYIRIRHHGSDDGLHETLDRVYDYILRQNNISIINQPCIFHYIDDQEITAEKDCRTDIYVGIKA